MKANTYDTTNTGSAVGNVEDVMRGASLVAPEDSPVYSTARKTKATAVTKEWLVDTYAKPRTAGVVEGADAESFEDAHENQARVFNYVQTLERTGAVSDDQELVESYNPVDIASAKIKKLKELNRDTEATVLGDQARSLGSKGNAARITAGLANILNPASSVWADNATQYATPTSQFISNTSPTEQAVNRVIRSIFDKSGKTQNLRLYADSGWQEAFVEQTLRVEPDTNGGRFRVNIDGMQATVPLTVQIFRGQQGQVTLINTNSDTSIDPVNLDTAYFMNPDYFEIAELGGSLIQKDLPDLGGGPRFLMRRKFCNVVKNGLAMAFWNGIQ